MPLRCKTPALQISWLVAFALVACGERPKTTEPVFEFEDNRFPHDTHSKVECVECHDLDSILGGIPARPGRDAHAPCDRERCHQSAFLSPPGKLCEICHEKVSPGERGASPLAPYPPQTGFRELASRFSHDAHLDFSRMEEAVGFHVSCTDCHRLESNTTLAPPDHATCARCHSPESTPTDTPSLSRCGQCHHQRSVKPVRARRFITGDLRFSHGQHRADRRGKLIPCATCHSATLDAEDIGNHSPPTTGVCVDCHDDASRVPPGMRMRVCETCHTTRRASLRALAPRSHLPASERPATHTIAFRTDHAAEARSDSEECARCHSFMSGNERATCDECHRVMKPRDHVVTFREFDHGPEAATDSRRCATCHSADYCTGCHRQTPRSHRPLMEFRMGGHGTQALLELRSCVTCHRVDIDCTTSGCHTRAPR